MRDAWFNYTFLTQKERDNETGLDYFGERYYASSQGRFTSTDIVLISESRAYNPQLWNSYSYTGNNPLSFTDPTGMERVQLGRSEAEIQTDLEAAKSKKKQLEAQKKALNNQKKTLSKADYEAQKSTLKGQMAQVNSSMNTLNVELAGTRMVNGMLADLTTRGLANGLKLSNFSVSTDPKNDFPNAAFPMPIGKIDAFVVQKADQTGPDYGGQIFLNAKGGLWSGAQNGGDDGTSADWILYGASALRHEQWHRDAPTHLQRSSERMAYQYQRPILQSFQHDFSNASFYQKKLKMVTDRGR